MYALAAYCFLGFRDQKQFGLMVELSERNSEGLSDQNVSQIIRRVRPKELVRNNYASEQTAGTLAGHRAQGLLFGSSARGHELPQ